MERGLFASFFFFCWASTRLEPIDFFFYRRNSLLLYLLLFQPSDLVRPAAVTTTSLLLFLFQLIDDDGPTCPHTRTHNRPIGLRL